MVPGEASGTMERLRAVLLLVVFPPAESLSTWKALNPSIFSAGQNFLICLFYVAVLLIDLWKLFGKQSPHKASQREMPILSLQNLTLPRHPLLVSF